MACCCRVRLVYLACGAAVQSGHAHDHHPHPRGRRGGLARPRPGRVPHPARPGLVPGRPGPPRPRPRGCWAPRQRVHVAAGRSRGSHAVTGSRPTAEDRIRAATWFADRGFGVFSVWSADADGTCRCPKRAACGSAGKHPIGRQGFLENTRDPTASGPCSRPGRSPTTASCAPTACSCSTSTATGSRGSPSSRRAWGRCRRRCGRTPPTGSTCSCAGRRSCRDPTGQLFGYVTRWGSGRRRGVRHRAPRSSTPRAPSTRRPGRAPSIAEPARRLGRRGRRASGRGRGRDRDRAGGYELPEPGVRRRPLRRDPRLHRQPLHAGPRQGGDLGGRRRPSWRPGSPCRCPSPSSGSASSGRGRTRPSAWAIRWRIPRRTPRSWPRPPRHRRSRRPATGRSPPTTRSTTARWARSCAPSPRTPRPTRSASSGRCSRRSAPAWAASASSTRGAPRRRTCSSSSSATAAPGARAPRARSPAR